MEALTQPIEPSEMLAAGGAATSPTWVMLKRYRRDFSVADAKTSVISSTTAGWLIRISLLVAPPPETSSFSCTWVGDAPKEDNRYDHNVNVPDIHIVAAHDDAVLFKMRIPYESSSAATDNIFDYFLYDTGTAIGRPPSLSLLPACYLATRFQRERDAGRKVYSTNTTERSMNRGNTGILCRGDGVVLAAQLEVGRWRQAPVDTAELCVLRFPGCEWDLKSLPIVHHDGAGKVDASTMAPWKTDAVVPTCDPFMSWVDYLGGILLCDMSDQTKLLYLPLPMDSADDSFRYSNDRPYMQCSRTLAGAGTGALRFISVDHRCCCGSVGKSTCARSRFAFMVTTWTMSLMVADEQMTWVKNRVIDCEELWSLPSYESLPRVFMEHPAVSFDDPDVVCLTVNNYRILESCEDAKTWIIVINMRNKTLLSALPQDAIPYIDNLVPAKLSMH